MKIIVVGCGIIGETIIESLVAEKHDVIAIDQDLSVVQRISDTYDVMGVCASGTEYESLKEAGVESAELFIAVTGSDELNMLSCFVANRMGAKYTVARIRDLENNEDSLSFMKQQLGLSLAINPERLMAEAIYNVIKLPSASKVERFSGRRLEMIEVLLKPDSELEGLSLIELRKKFDEKFLICAVSRGDEAFIPNGNFILKSGDKIGIISATRDIHRIISLLGVEQKQVKDVMILGAGITSNYLTKMLVSSRHRVKIIESNAGVCDEVCETLPGDVRVMHGDGMSQDLLLEEGILSTDAFVALTGRDQDNILISFYAKSQEVPKIISKVNSDELYAIAEKLGLDTMISPRKIVANLIVKYARARESAKDSQIESLYSIMGGLVEAVEFKVLPDFKYTNVQLKDMTILDGVLIAGISRGKEAIIPTGNDVILPGDEVIIVAHGKRILSLTDIIKG